MLSSRDKLNNLPQKKINHVVFLIVIKGVNVLEHNKSNILLEYKQTHMIITLNFN